MRKQVAFDVLTGTVDPTNKADFLARINSYIANGWEVLTTAIPAVNSSAVTVAVTLVKYEEVGQAVVVPQAILEEKRGPGRPKKEEVVPA